MSRFRLGRLATVGVDTFYWEHAELFPWLQIDEMMNVPPEHLTCILLVC